jgi:hypothetical protein
VEGLFCPLRAGIFSSLPPDCDKRIGPLVNATSVTMRMPLSMPATAPATTKSNPDVDRGGSIVSIGRSRRITIVRCRCNDAAAKTRGKSNKGDKSEHDGPPVLTWRRVWPRLFGSSCDGALRIGLIKIVSTLGRAVSTATLGASPIYSCLRWANV